MTKAKLTELQKGVLYAAACGDRRLREDETLFSSDLARDPITPDKDDTLFQMNEQDAA